MQDKPLVLAMALAIATASGVTAQVVPAGAARPAAGPPENFTGRVTVTMLVNPTPPGQAGTALVTFSPRARTNWHSHPAGQTLYVTRGCGWTQEQGHSVAKICKGDTVYVRPGVRHWHGATATTGLSHLAISETRDGRAVDWQEPVGETDYHGPAR